MMAPMEEAAIPFPSELQTPPVTTMKRAPPPETGWEDVGFFDGGFIRKMGNLPMNGGAARWKVYVRNTWKARLTFHTKKDSL